MRWSIWKDSGFKKRFTPEEQKQARAYFRAVLDRAKRFQAAINTPPRGNVPVSFYLIGGDCKETQSGLLLLRNEKKGRWETRFKASNFERSDGEKVQGSLLKPVLNALGDGVVTKASLAAETATGRKGPIFPVASEIYQCAGHNKLITSPEVQDKVFVLLQGAAAN